MPTCSSSNNRAGASPNGCCNAIPDPSPICFFNNRVNVGWSYADDGATVSTTPDAARDVEAFISIFFDVFDEFKGRAFHIAGESFGGRYVPLFASAVYDGAKKAVEEGRTPVNLTSVMIGNGDTHPVE